MGIFMKEAASCIDDIEKRSIEVDINDQLQLRNFFDYVKNRIKEYDLECNMLLEEMSIS